MPGDLPRAGLARFRTLCGRRYARADNPRKPSVKFSGFDSMAMARFARERSGESLSAQHFYRVKAGDIIYNRLFAWKGSFGLIGEDLAGCYVSHEFPLFAASIGQGRS